jgi:hypothetical protein
MTRREILTQIAGGALLLSGADTTWAQTPKPPDYSPNGDLRLLLTGAIILQGRTKTERFDLELDLERRGGIWEPEAWGFASGYNTADHYGPVSILERDDRFTIDVRVTIGGDLLVPSSAARYTLILKRKGTRFEGTYSGVFDNKTVSGKVSGTFREPSPALPTSGFTPLAPGEHPRLIFRKSDREWLKQRAATERGQAILRRLRESLADSPADGEANSARLAAGFGFLSYLTSDIEASATAREKTVAAMQSKESGRDAAKTLAAIALAYDFCYDTWDAVFRREVALWLEESAARLISGPGANQVPGSSELARIRGGAGLALVAIESDVGTAPRSKHLFKIAERSVARYLASGLGDRGFGPEGDQANAATMEIIFGLMQAYRAAFGREMGRGSGAEWVLPLYVLRSFPGPFGHPLIHRYGQSGTATAAVSGTLFALGSGAVSEAHRPAVRYFYDRYWGTLGDNSFGIESPHAVPYVLVNYPEDIPPQSPTIVLPRAVQDKRTGFCVFRTEEFVTTVYAGEGQAYNGRAANAGTFCIHGFGTDWAVRGSTGTRESENVALIRYGDLPGDGGGRVTHFEAKPDGSGAVSMDLDRVYRQGNKKKDIGIRSFRAFAVDYSGESGAPALFVLVDKVSGGTDREWLLHTAGKSLRTEGQAFVIEGEEGATLRGTFITPAPVRLHTEERNGIRTLHARADDLKTATFFVILTIQRGTAPPVSIQGRGLSAVVTVGKQVIQYARD